MRGGWGHSPLAAPSEQAPGHRASSAWHRRRTEDARIKKGGKRGRSKGYPATKSFRARVSATPSPGIVPAFLADRSGARGSGRQAIRPAPAGSLAPRCQGGKAPAAQDEEGSFQPRSRRASFSRNSSARRPCICSSTSTWPVERIACCWASEDFTRAWARARLSVLRRARINR